MERIAKLLNGLEDEIASEKFLSLYELIRKKHPPLEFCLTPQALIGYLHNQINPDYQLNDNMLSILILEYKSRREEKSLGAYFLIIFKPGLLRLFTQFKLRAKQFPSISELDLWFQIVTFFLEELSRLDLNTDRTRLAAKILGRLRNRLRDYFRFLFKEIDSHKDLQNISQRDSSAMPAQAVPKDTSLSLDSLVKDGIISKTDSYILLAAKVYGKSLKDLSLELENISYSAIRQRKVRAQKAIRAYLNKNKNSLSQFNSNLTY